MHKKEKKIRELQLEIKFARSRRTYFLKKKKKILLTHLNSWALRQMAAWATLRLAYSPWRARSAGERLMGNKVKTWAYPRNHPRLPSYQTRVGWEMVRCWWCYYYYHQLILHSGVNVVNILHFLQIFSWFTHLFTLAVCSCKKKRVRDRKRESISTREWTGAVADEVRPKHGYSSGLNF